MTLPAFGGDRVSDHFGRQLDRVEHDIVALAEAMPAYKYDFRPTGGAFEGVRSFGEQVKHLATMVYMTAAFVMQERSPHAPGTNDNGPGTAQGFACTRRTTPTRGTLPATSSRVR
jgi:hypothetical protein